MYALRHPATTVVLRRGGATTATTTAAVPVSLVNRAAKERGLLCSTLFEQNNINTNSSSAKAAGEYRRQYHSCAPMSIITNNMNSTATRLHQQIFLSRNLMKTNPNGSLLRTFFSTTTSSANSNAKDSSILISGTNNISTSCINGRIVNNDMIRSSLRSFSSTLSRKHFSTSSATETDSGEEAVPLTEGVITDKVLRAVQKHLYDRVEDLHKEMEEAGANKEEKEKLIEMMKKPISENSTWQDFGFDEFDRVEVLLEVEEAFDHVIPDEVADTIMGVKEAVDYMVKKKMAAA